MRTGPAPLYLLSSLVRDAGMKVVVTGDTTQIDVPDGRSGLLGLERTLTGIDGLTFVHLGAGDVVRHRIVADIVAAYERQAPPRA